jgi:hypothetical protein
VLATRSPARSSRSLVVAAIIGVLGDRESEARRAIGVVRPRHRRAVAQLLRLRDAATNILFGDIGVSTNQLILLRGDRRRPSSAWWR